MTCAVVVGNPKPASRTLHAATYVARELTGVESDLVVDLALIGPALLDWSGSGPASGSASGGGPSVGELVEQVAGADVVVVACPTYKAAYPGLLKLFLDRFSPAHGTGLRGLVVPLMLGGGPAHALAVEHTLRPVLAELGAPLSTRGLFVLDASYDDPAAYADWLGAVRPFVSAALHPLSGAIS